MYQINIATANPNVKSTVACDYYVDAERKNGHSLFRKTSLKALKNSQFNIRMLKMMDTNYANAIEYINLIYENEATVFAVVSQETVLKAHVAVTFSNNAIYVSEIIVPNESDFLPINEGEEITNAYLIYNEILAFIDTLINDDIEYIYFMTNGIDKNYEIALLGNEYIKSEELNSGKECYVKSVVKNNARNLIN